MVENTSTALKDQGKAILIMVSIAVIAILGMVVMGEFPDIVSGIITGDNAFANSSNTTIQATLTAFIAAFALVSTFATVTMLIIVIKVVIGVVKGLK